MLDPTSVKPPSYSNHQTIPKPVRPKEAPLPMAYPRPDQECSRDKPACLVSSQPWTPKATLDWQTDGISLQQGVMEEEIGPPFGGGFRGAK